MATKISWTEDQQRAIFNRGRNLLVSAAAGSGKTALLTERLKELVLNEGVDCRRILVLTFTRAAAAEMKQRFKQKLFTALESESYKRPTKETLEQINLITDAQISTIDSFASSTIKKYFEKAGIDPNFRIPDESEYDLLVNEVIDESFEELFIKSEREPDAFTERFLSLIDRYSDNRSVEGLKKELLKLIDFLSTLAHPNDWFKKAYENYEKDIEEFLESGLVKNYADSVKESLNTVKEAYKKLDIYHGDIPWPKSGKTKDAFKNEISAVLALDPDSFSDLLEDVGSLSFCSLRFPKPTPEDLKETVKGIRDPAKKKLNDLKGKFKGFDEKKEYEKIKKVNETFKDLYELSQFILKRINERKAENRLLTFSDLERKLLEILEDEKIREDIKNSYDYVFVDEYQDINQIQEEILSLVSDKNNRFMVGDLRQAIYRFRHADPSIFIEKSEEFESKTDQNELIRLNLNFRSSPTVIDSINALFSNIMSKELGEVDYNAQARLIANRSDETKPAELDLIVRDKSTDLNNDEIQALFLAGKIKEIVSSPDNGYSYKDIAILYRSINKKAATILKVLTEQGIPVLFDGEQQQVNAREISVFLKFISLIDNHKQDYPLLTVMQLPVFDFSLDEIVTIKKTYPDLNYFYEAVEAYRDQKEDALADRLKSFYALLDRFRRESQLYALDDYLWKVMLESDYYAYFGSLPGGQDRKRNLRLLIEKAKDFKETNLKGIIAFLDYVAKLEKNNKYLSGLKERPQDQNAVSLMSIHKSKGLEFPVVILSDVSKRFNLNSSGNFNYHKDYGYSGRLIEYKDDIKVKEDCFTIEALRTVFRREELSEEMRLLYVALTRAMDRLILVGVTEDEDSGEAQKSLLEQNTYLDWVLTGLERGGKKAWKVKRCPEEELIGIIPDAPEKEVVEVDEDLKRLIYDKLDSEKIEEIDSRPVKTSVSMVKRSGIEESLVEMVELEHSDERVVSPTEFGVTVHKIFQSFDLSRLDSCEDLKEEIKTQIEEMLEDGTVTPEELRPVDLQLFENFYASELGKRLFESFKKDPGDYLVEYPFKLDLTESEIYSLGSENNIIEVSGIIDCCFLEDGKWVLVDYKTDRYFNEQLWRQRVSEYEMQVELYEKALERLTKIPVAEKHIFFLNQNLDHNVTKGSEA